MTPRTRLAALAALAARLVLPLALILATALAPAALRAQSVTVASVIAYPAPAAADYDAGLGPVYSVAVSTSGGLGYETFLRAASTTLGNGKPTSHVRFRRSCESGSCPSWTTLGTTDQMIAPSASGSQTFYLDFQVASWSWTADAPFTYAVDLVFSTKLLGSTQASATSTFQVQVSAVRVLSTSGTSIAFSTPSLANLDAGSIQAAGTTTIATKANTSHQVVLRAASASMSSTNPLAAIPASDLQWSTDAAGTWSAWTGLSTTDATILSRGAGVFATTISVRYRQLLSWSRTTTGSHTLDFSYTIP